MKNIKIMALGSGVFALFVSNVATSMILANLYDVTSAFYESDIASTLYLIFSYSCALFCGIGAGYLGAVIARGQEIMHGFLIGLVIVLISELLTFWMLPEGIYKFYFGRLLTILYTTGGGYIRFIVQQKKKSVESADEDERISNFGKPPED